MLGITGATGQLGRLVIEGLLKSMPPGEIIALVRDPKKASDLAAKGVVVRTADYNRPETLAAAFAGIDKLLFISGNEVGQRKAQHKAVIDAAKAAGVKLIVYTSALHADTSPLILAQEHKDTEAFLKASGVPHVLLRHGWYTENDTMGLAMALAHGATLGSSGEGRYSGATRADYAAASVAVLTSRENLAGKTYELAGDTGYTQAEFAAELSRQSGKPVTYTNLPEEGYKGALVGAGLPEPFAATIAQTSAVSGKGAFFDDSRQLSRLIGRPTTPMKDVIAAALKA